MVSSRETRAKFIRNLLKFIEKNGLHGVDYNWEYPRRKEDWNGLLLLLEETRLAFDHAAEMDGGQKLTISMAYYPDMEQEHILAKGSAGSFCDLMHMMSYDSHGEHSTWAFGKQAVDQGVRAFGTGMLFLYASFHLTSHAGFSTASPFVRSA